MGGYQQSALSGRVIATPPTRPVAGARVAVVGLERLETTLAEDGTFELRLLPGDYNLEINPFGFTIVRETLRVTAKNDLSFEFSSRPLY